MKISRKSEIYEATLCPDTIDSVSEKVRSYLTDCGLPKQDVLRYAMSAEEILLKSADIDGSECRVRLSMYKRFFRQNIMLEIGGRTYNVYAEQESEQGILGDGILKNLGLSPDYSYLHNNNRYLFRIKKKSVNPFITLLIALCASGLVGALGYAFGENTRSMLTETILTPLNDVFLNILSCIAGPMVFLSVALGIYGIGDAATLKRIGKKLISSYCGSIFLSVTVFGLLMLPLFKLDFSGGTGGENEFTSVFNMLLSIVPKDIFSPFVNGNTLQIIFIAVLVGIAMLFLGQKTEFIAIVVEQINYIVQFLIEAISKLVPYFIFIVLLKIIWGDMMSTLSGIGRLLIIFIGAVLLNTLVLLLVSAIKNKVNPLLIAEKGLPSLIIGITTASSAAAFGTNMSACRDEFGIDSKISSFGIPLGMVTFKPCTAIGFLTMSLYFAECYHLSISLSWIIIMMLMAGIIAISTPPIPSGALTGYTVLFSQLGIPAEALIIALTCDTVFDFISTGFDQYMLPYMLLDQAGKLGLVDKSVLLKKKERRAKS